MENAVLAAIKRFSMLDKSKNVTVALSGGADSMSLLYVLLSLKDKLGINVSAAHFNHMIRGEEAERDEEFVKRECEKLNVRLTCDRGDVPGYAGEHKLSLETAAREMRYAFLSSVNTGVVATAHTASDNLETVLFNIARGTGLKGVCGIPPVREIYIRPLILCTRAEIENYCLKHNIDSVTDSTNLCDDYSRNMIRHTAVPVLKNINPSAESAAARMSFSLSEDEDFLNSAAEKYVCENTSKNRLDVSALPHPAVAKRAIKIFCGQTVPDLALDNLHLSEIYDACLKKCRVSLPLDMSADIRNGKLYLIKNSDYNTKKHKYLTTTEIRLNDLFTNKEKINNLLLKSSIDCDKIVGKSVLRSRQPGDCLRLAGCGCTKTLKKLMNEYRVPPEERQSIPVLSDDCGVVWVYGIGVAARCAVTESTKKVMVINVSIEQNITD